MLSCESKWFAYYDCPPSKELKQLAQTVNIYLYKVHMYLFFFFALLEIQVILQTLCNHCHPLVPFLGPLANLKSSASVVLSLGIGPSTHFITQL